MHNDGHHGEEVFRLEPDLRGDGDEYWDRYHAHGDPVHQEAKQEHDGHHQREYAPLAERQVDKQARDGAAASEAHEHGDEEVTERGHGVDHAGQLYRLDKSLLDDLLVYGVRAQRDDERRRNAERGSFRSRAPAKPYRAENGEDDDRDRQDVHDDAPGYLLLGVAAQDFFRHWRRIVLLHDGDDLHIHDVRNAEQHAGRHCAVEQLADGDVRGGAHEHEHDAGRDEDAQRAAGDYDAGREGFVVLRVEHGHGEEQTHGDDGRADDAGGRGKEDRDERRRDGHAAALAAEGDGQVIEQSTRHAGLVQQLSHQDEQRHREEVIVLAVLEDAEINSLEYVRPPEYEAGYDSRSAERRKEVVAGEDEHQQHCAHYGGDCKTACCHLSFSPFIARRRWMRLTISASP